MEYTFQRFFLVFYLLSKQTYPEFWDEMEKLGLKPNPDSYKLVEQYFEEEKNRSANVSDSLILIGMRSVFFAELKY